MDKRIAFEAHEENKKSQEPAQPRPGLTAGVLAGGAIQLAWPTEYRVITQPFGANPELSLESGLPGHEGLDIRAPIGVKVFACADGEVEAVQERETAGDPYGRWIRLRHSNGYRTLAGHLGKISVNKGAKVKARQVIGLAGPTGATAGGHIHLSLMQEGATAQGLTHYLDDIVDPTPFLLLAQAKPVEHLYPWPLGKCLAGLIANGDGSLPISGSGKWEAIKVDLQAGKEKIALIRKTHQDAFLMGSLRLIPGTHQLTPREWSAQIRPALSKHIEAGISFFEVLSKPNLSSQGCYQGWQSGGEFARWWIDAVNLLREIHPLGKFGFPALAPGKQVVGQRMDAQAFMEEADEALLLADWIGVADHWSSSAEMGDEELGARHQWMRRWYPDKLLFITEFANVDALTDPGSKDREYTEFMQQVQATPGIGAAFQRASLSA
ncbi:MAG: M23 family metallopeptidase [Anaerolineales bacterium]